MEEFLAPRSLDCADFTLRAFTAEDADGLFESVEASMTHLMPFIPWARADYGRSDSDAALTRIINSYASGSDFTLGIFRDGLIVGGTGFHLRGSPASNGNAEIGMWIHVDHAGTGLGTKVLREMLRWGFSDWPWERIEWRCDPRNFASTRVAEKCGMMLEGTLRRNCPESDGTRSDTHVFSQLRS